MPTYEFECKQCNTAHGISCKISEYDTVIKPGVDCPKCDEKMERVIGAPAVHMPANMTYNGRKKNI